MASIIFGYCFDMSKSFSARTLHRSFLLKVGLIILFVGSLLSGGCEYVDDGPQQALFPELAPGSYFGEIVLAGKRAGEVERLSLLVVVQQAGRVSWSVGDYTVRDTENSHSGVANLLLPFTIEVKDVLVELTWDRPRCDSKEGCSAKAVSISRWQGDVIWRGTGGKKRSIAVFKDNVGKIGGWSLRPLINRLERTQNGKTGAESSVNKGDVSTSHPDSEKSGHRPTVAVVDSATPEMSAAVQRFDLAGTLVESGFCSLSNTELRTLIGKLQAERKELAHQLYYTVKATPAGRLVWLSRLLLSQESSRIRPVAEVAVAPGINNEIEAEKKRLAALHALGIE